MKKIFTLLLASVIVAPMMLNAQGTKRVLIEEYTGAWCGFCPDGALKVEQLHAAYPGMVVSTGVHQGDDMAGPSAPIISQFPASGYPSGMIDRVHFSGQAQRAISRSLWSGKVASQLNLSTPVDVIISSTWDAVSRKVDINVKAEFSQGASGDMRIHCQIIEDDVTGTGPGYDQRNFYSSQGAAVGGSGHPYYIHPDPITGYEHQDVVRHVLSPVLGTAGIIPANVLAGTYSHNYSVTLPTGENEDKMTILAFVTTTDNSVMNVSSVPLKTVGINDNGTAVSLIGIYPNPVRSGLVSQIEYSIEKSGNVQIDIYNALGKHVSTVKNDMTAAGNHLQVIDTRNLRPGFYFVSIRNGEGMVTKKLSVVE